MKRLAGALIFLFLAAGHVYAVDSGSVPAAQQPVVKEVIGTGKIDLEAAIYPGFQPIDVGSGTDAGCQAADSQVFKTLALQPITTVSPTTGRAVSADTAKLGRKPTDLTMTLTGTEIPEAYRKTAKILVTWTIRIEGECPNWPIGHVICEPWIGTLSFNCPKGLVKTWLKATYKDKGGTKGGILGSPVIMEMPEGTIGPVTQLDPTLTGTYVITADNFPDKKIPADLELQILWENETSLRVYSPDGMRNMIVNVLPYTKD